MVHVRFQPEVSAGDRCVAGVGKANRYRCQSDTRRLGRDLSLKDHRIPAAPLAATREQHYLPQGESPQQAGSQVKGQRALRACQRLATAFACVCRAQLHSKFGRSPFGGNIW